MAIEPVGQGAIAFAFVPSEGSVDLDQRFDGDLRGPPDATRPAPAIHHQDMTADHRHGFAVLLKVAQHTGRRPFWTVDYQVGQFIGHFRTIAKGHDVIVVMAEAGPSPIGAPVFVGRRRFGQDLLAFHELLSVAGDDQFFIGWHNLD